MNKDNSFNLIKTSLNPDFFAYNQYRDYIIYRELTKIEKIDEFKKILEELIAHEIQDYNFWLQFSKKKSFKVSKFEIFIYKLMRKFLGLTFTAKFLERHEREMIKLYTEFSKEVDEKLKEEIGKIIEHERYHERKLISQIKEEKIEFMGSIILGLNDGLIELTGALVGFSFALQKHFLVALAGLITGISASLSMASSAYIQARFEKNKNPKKASIYTGISYFIIVFILVLPFFFINHIFKALLLMALVVFFIIISISFYASVIFERKFKRQFKEMLISSIGVAVITFIIGLVLRSILKINF